MGKAARKKREAAELRSNQSTTSITIGAALKAARQQGENERLLAVAQAAHDEFEHLQLLKLNDVPFADPRNRHKIEKTFKPMRDWLDQQERTGESDALPNGTVIIRPEGEDTVYPLAEAFHAVCDTYELVAADMGLEYKGEGLRRMAKMIDFGVPLTEREVRAARESLDWMESATLELTPTQFSNFTTSITIRHQMIEMGLLKKEH